MSDSVSKLLIERYGVMVFLVVIFVLAIIAILLAPGDFSR